MRNGEQNNPMCCCGSRQKASPEESNRPIRRLESVTCAAKPISMCYRAQPWVLFLSTELRSCHHSRNNVGQRVGEVFLFTTSGDMWGFVPSKCSLTRRKVRHFRDSLATGRQLSSPPAFKIGFNNTFRDWFLTLWVLVMFPESLFYPNRP